jgi:hypothetical protein
MTRALLLLLVFAVPGCQMASVGSRSAHQQLTAPAQTPSLVGPDTDSWQGSSAWRGAPAETGLAPTCGQMGGLGFGGGAAFALVGFLVLAAPFWFLKVLVTAPLEILRR